MPMYEDPTLSGNRQDATPHTAINYIELGNIRLDLAEPIILRNGDSITIDFIVGNSSPTSITITHPLPLNLESIYNVGIDEVSYHRV